ncbi:hypothetical protein JCM17092_15730 [Haloplanus litoreus]
MDREDGRAEEAEGRVGGVDGGEDDAFEAAMERHGTQRGVGTGAAVRDGVAASDGDGAHASGDAEARADRRPVEGEREGEAAEGEKEQRDGPTRPGEAVDGREDEAAPEQAGADRSGDDGGEGEADRPLGRPVSGHRGSENRRSEEEGTRENPPASLARNECVAPV